MKRNYILAAVGLHAMARRMSNPVFIQKTGKHYLVALLMLICTTGNLFSQVVTWTGAVNNDWGNVGNWTGDHLPYYINTVIIPNTANDPVISTTGSIGNSISNLTVQSGAVLTINNAVLTIYGTYPNTSFLNQGTVINNGWIWINFDNSFLSSNSYIGLKNEGVFTNNSTGTVYIGDTYNGFWNASGTFVNKGDLRIFSSTNYGLWNASGTFDNQSQGEVDISEATVDLYNETSFTNSGFIEVTDADQSAIEHVSGTFTNSGDIRFGGGSPSGIYALKNHATFNNIAGELAMSNFSISGLWNEGTFNNAAKLSPGYPSSAYPTGITNMGIFNNNTGGDVDIQRATIQAILNTTGATFNNAARLFIGDGGFYPLETGIKNEGGFNNNGGYILITAFTSYGVWNEAGAFNNSASLTIAANVQAGTPVNSRCIYNKATFNNNMGAGINVRGSSLYGIEHALGAFTNAGTISIGSGASVGSTALVSRSAFNNNAGATIDANNSSLYGIENISGTLFNGGNINIGSSSAVGTHGLRNNATFINNTGAQVNIDRSSMIGLQNNAGSIINASTITIGSAADIGTTGISNSGTINNNFGGIINVDRPTSRGIVNAAGALFANVATININNTSVNTMDYGIENNGTITNFFSAVLKIDGSSVAGLWNNGGTFNTTATLTIGSISAVGDRCIYNSASGMFNNTGGVINADNSVLYGIELVSGTFTNSATINIGASSPVGAYGLRNSAAFNNNAGGQINIDRCSSFGLRNNAGTFTNAATLNIGSVASVGTTGISNAAIINNNAGGIININRASLRGIINVTGTITNAATINIGALAASSIQYGIDNNATFDNAGGQINIDRATITGIDVSAGAFTNQASITIGALSPVTNLVTADAGTFSNGTGGTLKGTGNIAAANFTNAGGALSPGYSPGKMTFTAAETFSNNILSIEVNGPGTPGVNFDQVVVNGAATLGGTLALTFNYSPVGNDQIPILSATSRSGAFASVTGLPAGWTVNYTATGVMLSFGALPVEMTDFTARLVENPQPAVLLEWATATELNNKGFFIEHSMDGLHWSALGFVPGNGTTTDPHDYSFQDEKPLPGTNYYRLRQIDFDGREEFSKVVSVHFQDSEGFGNLTLFPNPVTGGALTLLVPEDLEAEITVRLFNASGQLVRSVTPGTGMQTLDMSDLPAGTYALQVWSGAKHFFEKIVVQR